MNENTKKLLNISDKMNVTLHCQEHGDYPGQSQQIGGRVVQTECPACIAERAAKAESKQLATDEENRERAYHQRLRNAGIPYYLWQADFDTFLAKTGAQKTALKTARLYADQFDERVAHGRNLVFCGAVGTGKTHLAAAIGITVLNSGYSVLMTGAFRLVMRVKDSYRADSRMTTLQAIDRLVDYDLLIIDEVGVQFGSESEKLILTQVINGRYEERLPTVVITNLTGEQLTDYLGDRIADRLCDRGTLMIPFDWDSYRGQRRHD